MTSLKFARKKGHKTPQIPVHESMLLNEEYACSYKLVSFV